ncbi:MAG: ferritin-like domain-containing protein [Alphaproteobacteria bacterium]|nr:ferritin-like domain-containing protein [Alphaproteobacteria bacterium]
MSRHILLPSFLLALGLVGCFEKKDDEDDGDSGGSTSTTDLGCAGGTAILGPDGVNTGYVTCPDGSVDRVSAESMDPTHALPACEGTEEVRDCETDADCTDGENGTCVSAVESYYYYDGYGPSTTCGCVYSCKSDADCGAGKACLPVAAAGHAIDHNRCVDAACTTGADCASGACGVSTYHDGCGWDIQLTCRTGSDLCRSSDECADYEYCSVPTYYGGSEWTCNGPNCDIGRPLLVGGVARTAATVAVVGGGSGGGWSGAEAGPQPPEAALLAAHWGRVAAMEHASVASFARFTLQLMALGAPPDLLAEAHAAGLDEIRHAQRTYGLAARFGGGAVGPGPLSLSGVEVQTDRAEVVRSLVAEACVGETLGVAEAHAALQACEDEGVRAVLEEILADEQRHATLAWKTLRWLLAEDAALVEVARAAADEALAALTARRSEAPGVPAFGMPSGPQRHAARVAAAEGLVRPLLAAVLGEEARVAA